MTIRQYWTRRGAWFSLLWCVAAANFFYCGYLSLHPHDPIALYVLEAASLFLASSHLDLPEANPVSEMPEGDAAQHVAPSEPAHDRQADSLRKLRRGH